MVGDTCESLTIVDVMPEDTFDVTKMNTKPGVKQHIMRDCWWGGMLRRSLRGRAG